MADPNDIATEVDRYLTVTRAYDAQFKQWTQRVTRIIKRYRDDMQISAGSEQARFNILWSNVQTLVPAVYSRLPKADAARRFGDNDQVGRVAAQLIERALDYEIEHYPDFRATMKNAVEDRFLGGRGVGWARYEPKIKIQDMPEDGFELTDAVENEAAEDQPEEIDYECAPTDYVHWKDFGHSVARTWEEVEQVWRWVYLTRDSAEERFGAEVAARMSFDTSPDQLTRMNFASRVNDRAKVCELWDKVSGKAVWFQDGLPNFLDERNDPLGLEGFFPCAKPLYATTTSDSLVPIPDFTLYQDQARELDTLADRIDGLVQALRVRGVFDASQPALQRLLTEGENNTLIGVDKWQALSEKGGLKGVIDILPIDMIASCLLQAYQAMDQIKSQIYEITGISDIIRGEGAASETATAQQIKGQYAGLRLRSMQETVALFATDLIRLKAQIICSKFQPKTILAYAAAQQMTPEDRAMIPQALQLLSENPLRNFRIGIAADSLVQLDENQNKQDRVEFLNAFSNFLREAVPAGQTSPQLVPMLMKMIQFGIGGFKQAASIEGTIETAIQALAQQAQNPPPNPEIQKQQAQQQQAQAQMQAQAEIEKGKAAADLQIEQMKAQHQMQLEQMKQDNQERMRLHELAVEDDFRKWKAQLEASTSLTVAEINAKTTLSGQLVKAEMAAEDRINASLETSPEGEDAAATAKSSFATSGSKIADVMSQMAQSHKEALDNLAQMHQAANDRHAEALGAIAGAVKAASAPKRLIRGPDGRAIGTETIQ